MHEAQSALRAVTFFVAIFAALAALQLYNLIRSGELAQTWRPFIVGAVVFAVWSLSDFAITCFPQAFEDSGKIALLVDVLRTVFVILFAAGLWTQRQLFYRPNKVRPAPPGVDGVEIDHADDDDDEREPASEAVA